VRRIRDYIAHVIAQKLSPAMTFIHEVPGSILGLDTECRDTFVIQADQKVSVHLMISTHVFLASLLGSI
jgi:hypothetical protein